MAGPLTLGAAPETLPHSSQYHQSQISFLHKEDGRGFFGYAWICTPQGLYPIRSTQCVYFLPSIESKIGFKFLISSHLVDHF